MVKDLYKKLRILREKRGLSQEHIAKKLGFSRPTYIQVERGERELTLSEAKKLADVFDMSFEDFLSGEESAKSKVVLKKEKTKQTENDLRVIMSKADVKKFKEVLLYILSKIGAKSNIGETALYKLLYFIDFDFYEKYETQLTGAKYIKNYYGPTPVEFEKIVEGMEKRGEIEKVKSSFFKYPQKKYLPRREPDLSVLSAEELAHIDWEIDRLGDMTASQLSSLSHIDTPWKVAKERESLEYEHVFYRPEETSVREYEEL